MARTFAAGRSHLPHEKVELRGFQNLGALFIPKKQMEHGKVGKGRITADLLQK
jgi:hypothetical protein